MSVNLVELYAYHRPTHNASPLPEREASHRPPQNAAVLLDCSVDKIDELISWGKLQTVKLGLRRVGIKMASIERVAERGVEA